MAKTYKLMLFEIYQKAITAKDLNLALEIADRMKGLPIDTDVPDERIQKFVEELDEMIANLESGKDKYIHRFEYGGQNFEVKII